MLPLPRLHLWVAAALLVGITVPLSAQPVPSPPGFSAPDSTQPVEAYRLPDWSYSILTVGGSGRTAGRWESAERDAFPDRTRRQFLGNLRLNGNYLHVWESEQRAARLFVAPDLNADWNSQTQENGDREEERDSRFFGSSLRTEGRYDRYVSDRTFLFTNSRLDVQYSDELTERAPPSGTGATREFTLQQIDLEWTVGAGIGFGRIRDVTPVIRALRVQERLRAVRPGASLSTDQIQSVARQFAQQPGYNAVYDRPDKAFWGDLFDQITRQAGDLSAFETYYVADALSERVGRRLDGWEVRLSPQLFRSYRDEERTAPAMPDQSTTDTQTSLQIEAEAAWYETVSLDHQVGLTGRVRHVRELDSEGPLGRNWLAAAEASWMWVLADRFRVNSRLRPSYATSSADDRASTSIFQVDAGSSLDVFIEDRLALSAGLGVRHDQRWRDDSDAKNTNTSFNLQFGVTYVLSRVLP